MKKIQKCLSVSIFLFSLIIFYSLLLTEQVSAQPPATPTPVDYQLPYPGILPDHPLYTFKKLRDWLLITFNRHPLKKAELYLLFSDKKIGMSDLLLEKRKLELAVDILVESQSDILKSASILPSLTQKSMLPAGLPDKIELATKKHKEIINADFKDLTDLKKQENVNRALLFNNQAISIVQSLK